MDPDVELETTSVSEEAVTTCSLSAPNTYSPFTAAGTYPTGSVAKYPWVGKINNGALPDDYPNGFEEFESYSVDSTVECSSKKSLRSHVDVTAGCLTSAATGGGTYKRGQIHTTAEGYFRAIAMGFSTGDQVHPVKWTDQGVEYRFFQSGKTDNEGKPGFKAFVRYRSEDNLYVASWRYDGVVQIQRKMCGEYVALKVLPNYGPPTPNAWHWLRFEAVGNKLDLYLDDKHVISTTDSNFTWGTAGIRIDSADGSYIDDWSIYAP